MLPMVIQGDFGGSDLGGGCRLELGRARVGMGGFERAGASRDTPTEQAHKVGGLSTEEKVVGIPGALAGDRSYQSRGRPHSAPAAGKLTIIVLHGPVCSCSSTAKLLLLPTTVPLNSFLRKQDSINRGYRLSGTVGAMDDILSFVWQAPRHVLELAFTRKKL